MCIRDRYMGAPKVEGFPFIESYQLKILAGISKFKGCEFCKKEDTANSENEEFAKAQRHFREIIADYDRRGIGTWWNEQRLEVIKGAEIEFERVPKRKYDYCCEAFQRKFNLTLTLLNWKYIARNVFFPIIYRFFLLAIVLACFASLIIIIADSEFKWLVKGFAIADLFLLVLIALYECRTTQMFISRKRMTAEDMTLPIKLLFFTNSTVILLHLATAITLSVLATRAKYKDKQVIAILYIVTAFLHDVYHYAMDVLVCVCVPFVLVWNLAEYLVRCRACAKPCAAWIGKCVDGGLKKCLVCNDCMAENEELIYLSCDERHVFHKECLIEICREVESCPLCDKPYKIVTGPENVHAIKN
eukprot:TRINITY_DN12728_c0_g3_i12.p1 TRINITY_DN12728_c0_g3~~TRINITY_DN12728_c0_g3_i12.p1  ORF type:complete len:359 (+),score=69.81 TRINITY_DN12728_c0_g3_i12:72-1148(+)